MLVWQVHAIQFRHPVFWGWSRLQDWLVATVAVLQVKQITHPGPLPTLAYRAWFLGLHSLATTEISFQRERPSHVTNPQGFRPGMEYSDLKQRPLGPDS